MAIAKPKKAVAKTAGRAKKAKPPAEDCAGLQIPDWMDFHADARPNAPAIMTPRLALTFGQLRAASVAAALRLEKEGLKHGQIAGIHAVAPALQLVLLLALHRLGVTACLLPQDDVRRHAGLAAITLDWLLTDADEKLSSAKVLAVDLEWLTRLELTAARRAGGFSSPDAVSLISMSSGTTSAPRPIGYSVAQMEKRIVWRSLGDQGTACGEKSAILASLGAMNGIHSTLGALWGGGTVYLGWTVDNVLEIIARDRIERLFCSAPLLFKMMEVLEAKPLDLSCLTQIYAGGDSLPPGLAQRVMKSMCPNLLTGFSTNEMGRLALGVVAQMGFRPEAVGYLMPWAEAQAVDEKDNVLPAGTEGYLRFKSPQMVDGYYGDKKASAERFQDGWFYSEDIGWITPEKLLVISGRRRDFIAVEGGRFNPARLDHGFAGHPKIAEAAGFGVTGKDGKAEIWVAIVARTSIEDAELAAFCIRTFGKHAPRHVLRLNRLPRSEAGKVMRRKLEELALENPPSA